MATVIKHIEASPAVYELLADGWSYSQLMTAKGWPGLPLWQSKGGDPACPMLAPKESGTEPAIREDATSGAGRLLRNPIGNALVYPRNVESVARLAALAERRTHPADDP